MLLLRPEPHHTREPPLPARASHVTTMRSKFILVLSLLQLATSLSQRHVGAAARIGTRLALSVPQVARLGAIRQRINSSPYKSSLQSLQQSQAHRYSIITNEGSNGGRFGLMMKRPVNIHCSSGQGSPNEERVFCVSVNLYVKPERRQEFLEVIRNNQKGTMELEPLAIEYTWGESQTEANTFHFQEKYKGKAGFEAHQQAPHFKRWEEFVQSDPFTKAPEVMLFEEA